MPYAGELNARVEIYENDETKNSSGELIDTEVLVVTRNVKRIDGGGSEIEEGRLQAIGNRKYQMRYDNTIALKASKLFVRDFDGDWQVFGPVQILGGRNRYMQLNCRKRGED